MSKQTPLTGPEWRGVYGSIRDHFHLSAKQRDRLDASPFYYRAMAWALSAREATETGDHDGAEVAWREVEASLREILAPAPAVLLDDRISFYADHEVWDREFDDPDADPITGHVIELERRDPSDPHCFPCCGGLRPAHTSRCRA